MICNRQIFGRFHPNNGFMQVSASEQEAARNYQWTAEEDQMQQVNPLLPTYS
jgi:hypothetical protein